MKTGVMKVVRIVLLSIATLMAALGIPVIVRSSHRLGMRGEVVQHSGDDDTPAGADPGR